MFWRWQGSYTICSMWRVHSTSCWLTPKGNRGSQKWGMKRRRVIWLCPQGHLEENFPGKNLLVFSDWISELQFFMFSQQRQLQGKKLIKRLSFNLLDLPAGAAFCWLCKVESLLMSDVPQWPECTTRQLREERVDVCPLLADFSSWWGVAATPQGFFSLSPSIFLSCHSHPAPPPQGLPCVFFAVGSNLHKSQSPVACSQLSSSKLKGVSWWIYKGAMGRVGRRSQEDCERGNGEATVTLMRTSCICFTLFYSLCPSSPSLPGFDVP